MEVDFQVDGECIDMPPKRQESCTQRFYLNNTRKTEAGVFQGVTTKDSRRSADTIQQGDPVGSASGYSIKIRSQVKTGSIQTTGFRAMVTQKSRKTEKPRTQRSVPSVGNESKTKAAAVLKPKKSFMEGYEASKERYPNIGRILAQ